MFKDMNPGWPRDVVFQELVLSGPVYVNDDDLHHADEAMVKGGAP
jgi:hypothetical protein